MSIRDDLLNRAIEGLLAYLKYEKRTAAPAPPPEPEPRKLRQSEQPGIDMRKMGENAVAQARSRSLRAVPQEVGRRIGADLGTGLGTG